MRTSFVGLASSMTILASLLGAQSPLPDLLSGQRYMKQTQDVSFASVYLNQQNTYNVDVLTFNTANSQIGSSTATSQTTIATTSNVPPNTNLPGSPSIGVKSARMFDAPNDQFAALVPTGLNAWSFVYYNPPDSSATPARSSVLKSLPIGGSNVVPTSSLGSSYTFVVMGNFRGDGLKQALGVFAGSSDYQNFSIGMAVMGEQPYGNNPTATDSVVVGPGYYTAANTNQQQSFINSNQNSITVGDFNGDGRDEIAAIMNDSQTVRFYSVDPNTYAISPMSPASITLPQPVYRAALVAGRFYAPSQVDLVVVGVSGGSSTMLFPYINTQGQTAGTFNPQIKTPSSLPQQPTNTGAPYGFFASAAPIILPGANQTNTFGTEQLVVLSQNASGDQSLWIGDFFLQPYAFTQLAYSELGDSTCTVGMQVGNFDNQDSNGNYNGAVQLAIMAGNQGCNSLFSTALLVLENINVPDNVGTGFGQNNWINVAGAATPYTTGNVNGLAWPTTLILNVSDVQGRSQQLGAPQIVTIPLQTQPEVVLPMPPMHVDYIVPPDTTECTPGTLDSSGRCVVGISYSPTTANSKIPAFANQFVSSTNQKQTANHTATSSWGLSIKTSIGANISFNDLEENESVKIKDTAKSLFNNKVSNQTITNGSTSSNVTAQTVTTDSIFFSQRDLYVYYYPVLGTKDSSGNPIYVNFSVPSNLHHFTAADGPQYDWYQPVHETGNVLSYPWSQNQLSNGYSNGLDVRTTQQSGCQTIGATESTFSTNWQGGTGTSQSIASSATFSNDLSISESGGAGVSGIDGADISESIDIGTSSSLASLNVETSSIEAGEGVKESSPGFPNANNFSYYVQQFIFGQKPPSSTSIWDQIVFNTTDSNGNNYFNQATTGPLYVGFIADPAPNNADPNAACGTNSSSPGWANAYLLPDIGLNHPDRWAWSTASSTVSFNYQNGTTKPTPATQSTSVNPFTASFYPMKGFFITVPNPANNRTVFGPNLTSASAGTQLQLTTRVYNFSLKDTDDPTLTQTAAKIHVAFYGQQACNDGSDVCAGTLFKVGEQILAQPIPGYKSNRYVGQPNWILASVSFDTTGRTGQNLVFWVITWMEDANGNRVQEMPGHGLKATPNQNLTNLLDPTQLAMELYSNNVGLYGVHTQFTITPPVNSSSLLASSAAPSGASLRAGKSEQPAATTMGSLHRVRIQGPSTALLDDSVRLNARVRATDGPMDNITVTYWDGNPSDGQLIDTQKIHHIDANDFYLHATSFKPRSCGVHNIYVDASTNQTSVVSQTLKMNVTVDSVALIEEMIDRLRIMKLSNQYKNSLLMNLRLAKGLYRQGEERRARQALKAFGTFADLTADAAGANTRTRLAAMAGEAAIINGCEKLDSRR